MGQGGALFGMKKGVSELVNWSLAKVGLLKSGITHETSQSDLIIAQAGSRYQHHPVP